MEFAYAFYRGASGFALAIAGLSLLVEPGAKGVKFPFGMLFISLGALFLLSWSSERYLPPEWIDDAIVIAAVFAISQSLFEITLYLFGDEAVAGSRKIVYRIGAAWSAFLWLASRLDPVIGLAPIARSVEDGREIGPLRFVASIAIYLWPIAMSVASLLAGKRRPRDYPTGPGPTRAILGGVVAVFGILMIVGLSLLVSSRSMYRAGHAALQTLMLAWFLFFKARPDAFKVARREIEKRHKQLSVIGQAEATVLAEKLARLAGTGGICTDPSLDVRKLARALKTPEYRVSAFLNSRLGRSFPDWLNDRRIGRVRELLETKPGLGVLEAAVEAGYSSKTVFNRQFRARVGMSPTEYRDSLLARARTDSPK